MEACACINCKKYTVYSTWIIESRVPVSIWMTFFFYDGQGAIFKRWSKRYYTLDKGLLLYYPDEQFDTSKPLDHLVMHDLISGNNP